MKKKSIKLTSDDVKRLAKLANLSLTETEINKFTPQIEKIIEYFDVLNKIDTKNIEELNQVAGLCNVTRPDKSDNKRILNNTQATANAKRKYKDFFQVDNILTGQ